MSKPKRPRLTMLQPRLATANLSSVQTIREQERCTLYDRRAWRNGRLQFLHANPLCIDCRAEGRIEAATVVDHDIPHRGDEKLFFDRSNWRARCKKHHDAKTAAQDGGFGNPRREPGRS